MPFTFEKLFQIYLRLCVCIGLNLLSTIPLIGLLFRPKEVIILLNTALVRLDFEYCVHTWRLYFMKVMDKPDVQRMVTRFRREPNNYLLGKKLRTIIWREKTKQNKTLHIMYYFSKNLEKACERGIRYSDNDKTNCYGEVHFSSPIQ